MNEINFVELKNIYECVNLLLDYYGNQNIINVGDKNIATVFGHIDDLELELVNHSAKRERKLPCYFFKRHKNSPLSVILVFDI